jgi:hypothetical protein
MISINSICNRDEAILGGKDSAGQLSLERGERIEAMARAEHRIGARVDFEGSLMVRAAASPANPSGRSHRVTRNVTFHGRLFEEGKMLALAHALETRLEVWQQHPSIA